MVKKYLSLCHLRQHIVVLLFCILQITTADFTSESTNASAVIFPETKTTSSDDTVTEPILRLLGNWTNNETCVPTDEQRECGPGLIIQIRNCTDGAEDKCDDAEWLDDNEWKLQGGHLTRMISCAEAGSPLSDCERILSVWYNVTQCEATGKDKTCGPGIVMQEKNCTDGTIHKCADLNETETHRTFPCNLPECEGNDVDEGSGDGSKELTGDGSGSDLVATTPYFTTESQTTMQDGVRIADDTLDNDDTLNTTQSDSESTGRGETTTNSTSDHVQNTEHSTLRNTQTEESSAMSTSTSEASPKNPSKGEKCCRNRGIPNQCFGFCTPVSTEELLRSSLVDICNEVFDSITECRNPGKGTSTTPSTTIENATTTPKIENAGVASWIYAVAIAPIVLGLIFVALLITWYQRRKKSKVMDNWKYGDFRKGRVSEVEITPIVRNGKAKVAKKGETSLINTNAKDFSIQLDLGGDVGVSRAGFYG